MLRPPLKRQPEQSTIDSPQSTELHYGVFVISRSAPTNSGCERKWP